LFALSGCSPIGYVSAPGTSNPDDFWTVPRRLVYDEGSDFIRADDLWVFVSSKGITQKIDVGQVFIRLIKDPESDKEASVNRVNINHITTLTKSLVGVGRKLIIVSYQDMSAEYSIEINDLTGNNSNGGDEDGFQLGDGDGFIKWR
jgi:hypothetical protein